MVSRLRREFTAPGFDWDAASASPAEAALLFPWRARRHRQITTAGIYARVEDDAARDGNLA